MEEKRLESKYFEEFNVGDHWITPYTTVTEADIVMFNHLIGNVERIFTDMEFVKDKTLFKQRFATGAMTVPFSIGLSTQLHLVDESALAMLNMQAKFSKPLLPNDTIHVNVDVISKRETSKADRGIIEFKYTTINQRGERICESIETILMSKRGAKP